MKLDLVLFYFYESLHSVRSFYNILMASNFTPAGAPPLGVVPNLVNPKSLYPEILATVILSIAILTIYALQG